MRSIATPREWQRSVWIARDPNAIWNFLVDVRNHTLSRTGVLDAKWVSAPPYGVGSAGLYVLQGTSQWPWQVTLWQEPLFWTNSITGGRFGGGETGYRIQPDQTGSRVTLFLCPPPGILMRVRAPFMKREIIDDMERHLDRLKTVLEA